MIQGATVLFNLRQSRLQRVAFGQSGLQRGADGGLAGRPVASLVSSATGFGRPVAQGPELLR
jgi:hypothetical protein